MRSVVSWLKQSRPESSARPRASASPWPRRRLGEDARRIQDALQDPQERGDRAPEVELFHERARIRESLHSATDEDARRALRKQLTELEPRLSLRLEALQRNGAL